jgi:hypothetical protein
LLQEVAPSRQIELTTEAVITTTQEDLDQAVEAGDLLAQDAADVWVAHVEEEQLDNVPLQESLVGDVISASGRMSEVVNAAGTSTSESLYPRCFVCPIPLC